MSSDRLRSLYVRRYDGCEERADAAVADRAAWKRSLRLFTPHNEPLFRTLQRHVPHGIVSFDDEGDPVVLVCIGKTQPRVLKMQGCTDDVCSDYAITMMLFLFDEYLPSLARTTHRVSVLIDVSGLSMDHIAMAKYAAAHAGVAHQRYFPYSIKRLVVVRATALFTLAWRVLKYTLVTAEMRALMRVCSSDGDIAECVPRQLLPCYLGGSRPDALFLQPSSPDHVAHAYWAFFKSCQDREP
jgi:hypothetical protein